MRLRSICSKNYRTLESFNLVFDNDFCTISGKNNAGKSNVIKLMNCLLQKPFYRPWFIDNFKLEYQGDYTQWRRTKEPIEISCIIILTNADDPALISFINRFMDSKSEAESMELQIKIIVNNENIRTNQVNVGSAELKGPQAREIIQKVQNSNVLMVHNSASRHEDYWIGRGRSRAVYEIPFSSEEQRRMAEADKTVQKKLKQVAKGHRDELNKIMGKLSDKYDIEFTTLEGYSTKQIPLSINLKDKHVEVPLTDWGSGTQNRTHILMSIFNANRIKMATSNDDKITPIVLIEEPESFLHPSAQAEFGKILGDFSREFGIQIIVSTHSPYMLNQVSPNANILLRRKIYRNRMMQTERIETNTEHWMEPFADHLGVAASEFANWYKMFSSGRDKILLVEGDLDREYFHFLRKIIKEKSGLKEDVEIIAYNGKDALKNSALIKFIIGRMKRVFITFDLDASMDVKTTLESIGLRYGEHFMPVGIDKPGKESIEGLLPDCVLEKVYGREVELVTQLQSQKNDIRKSAKNKLKKKLLAEFTSRTNYNAEELKYFIRLGQHIGKYYSSNS